MDALGPYLTAILPTILVSVLFYFLIKSMIEGDRRERLAQKRFEKEEDARRSTLSSDSSGTVPPNGTAGAQDNSDPDS